MDRDSRLAAIRGPMLWILIPLVVGAGMSFLIPRPTPLLIFITRPGFMIPLVIWFAWMVAGFVKRFTIWPTIFYRVIAAVALSVLFHTVLPKDWPWWVCLIPGILLTSGLSIGLDILFSPRAATARTRTRVTEEPTTTQARGRREEVAIGLNIHAPNGQAAFVDAGRAVEGLGISAQADLLAASNHGRQIDAEQRRVELEHLKKVIDDSTTDELTRTLARMRYHALLGLAAPQQETQSTQAPLQSTWEGAPYIRGKFRQRSRK